MKYLFVFFFALLGVTFNSKADAETVDVLDISNISYDYEMIDTPPYLSCKGIVSFTIKYPQNTASIVVGRTRQHIVDYNWLLFSQVTNLHLPEDGNTIKFESSDNWSWGAFFRVRRFLDDGSSESSPIYCTNDYMQPEDIERILEHAALETPEEASGVDVRLDGKTLRIETQREIKVSVYTTTGICVYSGSAYGSTSIPLDYLSPQILIIRYNTDDQTKSQKILLQ